MTEEQIKAKQEELTAEFNTLAQSINSHREQVNQSLNRQVEIQGAMKLLESLKEKPNA